MGKIEASELIINDDGSVFHLHLLPEELADDIILVGDPGRVELVASHFEKIETRKQNREFCSVTGWYKRHRFTVLSTGIGPDNIDIVVNELDALANIDFGSRTLKKELRRLNMVRIGTSGSVQADIPVDSFVISEKSIGCDGVLHFYGNSPSITESEFEDAFIRHCGWNPEAARPYVISADQELVSRLHDDRFTIKGVTLTAVGFYGPQGRILRLPLAMPGINGRISSFRYNGYKVTNYEMESAVVAGLGKLLGHKACTICLIIANRADGKASADYHTNMKRLVGYTLDRLAQ